MWFQLKEYLNFKLKSTNQHGIHSPFIFDLVTQCFYKNTPKKEKTAFKAYKLKLLQNKNFIEVTDFGAGSRVFKTNNRQVAKIAKVAGISKKEGQLLIRLVQYFKPKHILEIGTSLGLGTAALHLGNVNAQISTLEGCPNTAEVAITTLQASNFNNINVVTGDFKTTLPKAVANKKYDLIYFDGNHTKKATLDYFEQCLPTAHNNSIFIFDDIYWNNDMKQAWEIIKKHPKVRVTMDTYFWGILFFRAEQAKEHFTIRV